MIKNIKPQSDYFFPEIPKWITHYGFIITIALLISFIVGASMIEYSDMERVDVILKPNSQQARLSFAAYKRLNNNQSIIIDGPFKKPLKAYLKKEIMLARDNHVFVPVVITDSTFLRIPIDGQLICQGAFKTSKGSLLTNIINSK